MSLSRLVAAGLAAAAPLALGLTAALPAPAQAATAKAPAIDITAMVYDPAGPDYNGDNAQMNREIVFIHNNTNITINLTGWTLVDRENHRYKFPTYKIGPYGTVQVHTGTGTDNQTHRYFRSTGYIWNNNGDSAMLKNATGGYADACSYGAVAGRTTAYC